MSHCHCTVEPEGCSSLGRPPIALTRCRGSCLASSNHYNTIHNIPAIDNDDDTYCNTLSDLYERADFFFYSDAYVIHCALTASR